MLESELDENDPLQNYIGELNGETLLAMCYSVSPKISQEVVNMDTIPQQISTFNPIDFYGNQRSNHICNKHPSYPVLRYSYVQNYICFEIISYSFYVQKMAKLVSTCIYKLILYKRYNIKMKNEILPKESYSKQAISTKQVLNLSDFSLKVYYSK